MLKDLALTLLAKYLSNFGSWKSNSKDREFTLKHPPSQPVTQKFKVAMQQ